MADGPGRAERLTNIAFRNLAFRQFPDQRAIAAREISEKQKRMVVPPRIEEDRQCRGHRASIPGGRTRRTTANAKESTECAQFRKRHVPVAGGGLTQPQLEFANIILVSE